VNLSVHTAPDIQSLALTSSDLASSRGSSCHQLAPGGDEISSPIERSEAVDGRLVLQGAEDGLESVRDSIGWSLSIDETSGNMALTAFHSDISFAIFGACTPL